MFEAISITVRYWIRILIRGADRGINAIKDELIRACIFLIAIAIIAVLFTYGILTTDIASRLLNDIRSELRGGIVFVTVVIVLFIFINLAYIPAKIYDEMGGFVDPPLTLLSDSLSEGYTSIKVENKTPYDVTDCILRLTEVIHTHTSKPILRRAENLTWSSREHSNGHGGNEPKTVITGNPRLCDVAEANPAVNEAIFTTWPPAARQTVGAAKYKLTISISGKWQEKPFDFDETFELLYNNGNDIQLNEVINHGKEEEKQI